jgi:SAM-dependent methyltransferase
MNAGMMFTPKILYRLASTAKQYFRFSPIAWIRNVRWFSKDLTWYRKHIGQSNFVLHENDLYPCLDDKTTMTPVEPIYFYQDSWAAAKIFSYRPSQHVDVGSSVKTIGIISGFVPVTFIDIRPIEVSLPSLTFKAGTVLSLPFDDHSVESVSSLCVIEHIGLGRYGDPLDPRGSEKAIAELIRITKPGGKILFSVPVDKSCKIYFNAHRAFTPEYIYANFAGCRLLEEKYIYGFEFIDEYNRERGFGVGVYLFEKR